MSYSKPNFGHGVGDSVRVPSALDVVQDYKSLYEVMSEVRDTLIVDLGRYVTRLPAEYSAALLPEPAGVYLYGGLNPIIAFSPATPYYSATRYKTSRAVPDIRTFKDFIECKEDVLDRDGSLVARCPFINRGAFREQCTYNYSAIYLAAIAVWDTLSALHRHTCPVTTLPLDMLNERNYLISEVDYSAFRIDAQPGICELLVEVDNFIGRDLHHVYTLRMQNTTLYVDKGNDYRVIEYYRQYFEQVEERLAADYGF